MHLSALVYECNGDEVMLRAAINGVDKLNAKSVHITGSPVSVNEYLGPVSSTHESEHCNYLRYPEACSQMARVTGEALYGDMIERTIFNGAQGARKKDERAIAYLSSPNQIYATRESTPTLSDYQSYSPCHAVSCCPVNSVGVIPEFVRSSVMADGEDGLYFLTYCPGTVNYKGVSVKVDTVYPFADTVKLDVEGKTRLHLRRPGFCTDMTVTVNGESICSEADERGYVGVDVTDRAEVVIAFTFKTEIIRIDDSDGADKSPIAFLRGPLVFALPIEGRWNEIYPRGTEGLYGQWPTFNVTPAFNEVPVKDHYEKILRRKYQTCWNVCIDESIKASDLTLNMNEVVGYPWENPPVTLTVPAYRAPFLNSPYPAKTFEHFGKTLQRGEEMTVTLVPYGCTNLRITYFPRSFNLTNVEINGNMHSISGITLEDSQQNVGIFNQLKGTTIKNVYFLSGQITSKANVLKQTDDKNIVVSATSNNVGILAGSAEQYSFNHYTSQTLIDNVTISGFNVNLIDVQNFGSIFGTASYSQVVNCVVTNTIVSNAEDKDIIQNIGSLIGSGNNLKICYNESGNYLETNFKNTWI